MVYDHLESVIDGKFLKTSIIPDLRRRSIIVKTR